MNYLGCYIDASAQGFITAITDTEYVLHTGETVPIADSPIPLWTPPPHLDLSKYLSLLGKTPTEQVTSIIQTWTDCANLSDLPKPTHTEKYNGWTIGACFKASKLTQLQITGHDGTWYRNIQPIAATKKDCFSLGRSAIDYIESVLHHLPDPDQFTLKPEPSSESSNDDNPPQPGEPILEHVAFEQLIRDAGTQQRQNLQPFKIEEYCQRYLNREEAPPAEVYRSEAGDILKHGFHRAAGKWKALGSVRTAIEIHASLPTFKDEQVIAGFRKELDDLNLLDFPAADLPALEAWLSQGLWCKIIYADKAQAVWDSCSDNADNGASRTRADLWRAVDTALTHPNSRDLSDAQIAAHVKTSPKTIAKRRSLLVAAGRIEQRTQVKAHRKGKTYVMNVSKIKKVDAGRQGSGHTFEDVQALYAPFGEFKRWWDPIKKFVFEWPTGKCHFRTLDEAVDKFAKLTDGLPQLADMPPAEPAPEAPKTEFKPGDFVRGFDYTDGRRELRGNVASVNHQTIVLHTGKRIFVLGAEHCQSSYAPTDDRGQTKTRIAQTIDNAPPQFEKNNYALVVVDPPWSYGLREMDATHRGRTPYPNMDAAAIKALPVADITAPDAYCLLWATANHLPLAFECLAAWGFDYKAVHTWVKTTLDGANVKIGLGHYGRNCAEFFLIGTKGNPGSFSLLGLTDVPSVIHEAPKEHSAKPDKFYHHAHRLANALGGETIELFARSEQPGWDLWGAEAPTPEKQEKTA
jgi:N6-adenosine-specific RNA methylase IME4